MTRRRAVATGLSGAVLAGALLAGCTGAGATARAPERSRSATLAVPIPGTAAPTFADGATPGALSVAVSRSLFATAPVVVLARADDPDSFGEATREAERLGVPLLLQDGAGTDADPALRAEVERLHAPVALAIGTTRRLTGLPARLAGAGELPRVVRPAPVPLSVLVRADGDPAVLAGAAAVSATARGVGATVVAVRGEDPRADPAAVHALAGAPRQVLVAGGFGPPERFTGRLAVAAAGRELPGGGAVVFPGRRFVALYGTPGSPSLGVLGEQGIDASIDRARKVGQPYAALSEVPVVPAFEVLATVASGAPGLDGDYSNEVDLETLRPWVERAGAAGIYVVLDLQPGRADFLAQAKAYAPLLLLPHVGLALDAEWRLAPNQKPLQQVGSVGVAEVNSVIDWLARLTAEHALPQKLLVLHQFKLSMIRDEHLLDTGRDQLAVLVHMDGQGAPGLKDQTWSAVTRAAPAGVTFGWKNFYDEDEPMLTPSQTMARRPTPLMISYQ